MARVAGPITARARELWRTWGTPGAAPRGRCRRTLLRAVYGLWIAALTLKLLGSTLGRLLALPLAARRPRAAAPAQHRRHGARHRAWSPSTPGRATASTGRRCGCMQAGIAIFLLAVPVDLINHRVNGLDITAWSVDPRPALPRHRGDARRRGARLVAATAPDGRARRCWCCCGRSCWRPCGSRPSSRSTGCSPSPRGTAGAPDAEPILLQFAADQLGRPVDRAAVLHFALPVPDWLYPVWLVAAAGSCSCWPGG